MRSDEYKNKIINNLSSPYRIDNFITETERNLLKDYFNDSSHKIIKNTGPIVLHLSEYDYQNEVLYGIKTRVEQLLNSSVYFGHFFYTNRPHIIHNDDSLSINVPYKGINIPIETCEETSLCIFDQFYLDGPCKFFNGSTDIPTYHNLQKYEYSGVQGLVDGDFDESFRIKHLNHLEPSWLQGLSIKEMIQQTMNCGIVFDTVNLHCSTNFKQSKLGLSFFTHLI
jgi:hypothetical protein